MNRRDALAALALAACPRVAHAGVDYPDIVAGRDAVELPRDHGSHPRYRTEWWYITGWMRDAGGVERGVQVTFFRSRPGIGESSASS